MYHIEKSKQNDQDEFYNELISWLKGILGEETDWLANVSNAAALLYQYMPNINWAGFYFYKNGELVLGPFQGKPACVRIALGKGVCGTAALKRKVLLIEDVHDFQGHIACDEASRSEIVLPIISGDRLIGVIDIDSPIKARFSQNDADGLQKFIEVLNEHIQWRNSNGFDD